MTTYKTASEMAAQSLKILEEISAPITTMLDDFIKDVNLRRSIEKRDAIVYYFANGKWPDQKPLRIRAPSRYKVTSE